MTSLRNIRETSVKSYRYLQKPVGIDRNPMGIYKDHAEMYDELGKYRRNTILNPIELKKTINGNL